MRTMEEFPLRTLEGTRKKSVNPINKPINLGSASSDFDSIFNAALIGGNPGESTSSGFSFEMLMMPLMFALIEKLLANQINDPAQFDLQSFGMMNNSFSQYDFGNYAHSAYGFQAVPTGLPLQGRMSQGSHAGHVAVDYAAPTGTPVRSTMAGRVVSAGWNNEGYGNLVIVENGPYKTYYAHLSEIPVSVGQMVQSGMVIGLSGNTGNSTGPHLHYEVRINGKQVNPQLYTNASS